MWELVTDADILMGVFSTNDIDIIFAALLFFFLVFFVAGVSRDILSNSTKSGYNPIPWWVAAYLIASTRGICNGRILNVPISMS